MDIVKVKETYHIKIHKTTLICLIAWMPLSFGLVTVAASKSLIMEATLAIVTNRAKIEEAKRMAQDIFIGCPAVPYAQERLGPTSR